MPTKLRLRRSARQSNPTLRGKEYFGGRGSKGMVFPSTGDEIKVKWILDEQPVWWPATVVSLHS